MNATPETELKEIQTPDEYIKSLKLASCPEDIETAATNLYQQLNATGIAERTLVNKLTPYNKVVKAAFPVESLQVGIDAYVQKKRNGSEVRHLHFLHTTNKIDFDAHNEAATARLNARMENPAVVHADKFIECMIECLESDDEYELSAGLIAASGRRAIEVWRLGEFKATEDPYTVTFSGQAKRRDYGVPKDERASYDIRLLIPAEAFLKLWRQFKKSDGYRSCQAELKAFEATLKGWPVETLEPKLRAKFHSLRGRMIDRAVKLTFGESQALENLDSISTGHQTSSHVLRNAAVNLLVQRDVKSNATGKALIFIAAQLGHYISGEDSIQSIGASYGYTTCEVVGEVVTLDNAFKTATIRLNHSDLERFNAISKRLNARNQQQTVHWMLDQVERVINLEKELAELRRQVSEAETAETAETVTQESEPMPQTLTPADIQKLVAETVAAALAGQQVTTPPVAPVEPEPVANAESPKSASNPALITAHGGDYNRKRGIDARGEAALAKVAAAYWAIADHNDKQLTAADRWYIGPRLLKDATGVSYPAVKRWFIDNETTVAEHNDRHSLASSHNRQHGRNGTTIKDVIKLG